MVSIEDVRASNARISTDLPSGLVAVFVGSTSGIGEYTMVQFAKHAVRPRIHFVGRSQESADRLQQQLTTLNPDGTYIFHKADTSLLRNVDAVCRAIKEQETAINILVLSTGTLLFGTTTEEDLHFGAALVTYSRNRFTVNLLPLLERAQTLRRVVSVFAGTKEGPVDVNDLQRYKMLAIKARGHAASNVTLSLEAMAAKAPTVTFVHSFPGFVKSNLIRGGEGAFITVLGWLGKVREKLGGSFVPNEESGDRHVFAATSAMYPGKKDAEATAGIPFAKGGAIAKGSDGKPGSGVYTVDEDGSPATPQVTEVLAGLRKDGTADIIWKDQEAQFERITGVKAI